MKRSSGEQLVRPVSPYTPYVTSVMRFKSLHTMGLSILHRITGAALSAGLLLFVYWLWVVASGAQAYQQFQIVLSMAWMQALLIGWVFSFSYHFLNGIRHLVWDAGWGFEPKMARIGGYAVLAGALLATYAIYVSFTSG